MATRLQSTKTAFGKDKEATYDAGSSEFLCFPKTNTDIISPASNNEDDSAWIGKGNEFATQHFRTNQDVQGTVQKFGSAEWLTYIIAYGFGDVSETTGTYTIKPMDPADGLQLPSFSVVEQIPDQGDTAKDHEYKGCVVDSFGINFAYGPGLRSVSANMTFRGSGSVVDPSSIEVPAVTAEHHMLSSGMTAFTINGINYLSDKTGLSGSFNWSNALLTDEGYFVGSGVDGAGYAVRGRLEYGTRVPTFEVTARLTKDSTEYTKLRAQTTGTATVTFYFDSTHTVSFAFEKVGFKQVENKETNGIVSVTTQIIPMYATSAFITVTAKCGISGIAQEVVEP